MRFFIETVTGRKGYKSFKSLNEYVDFMTYKGHLVKTLKEADLPYSDKPVKLPKVSKSKGWEEVTDFGDIDREAEKAKSVIASSNGFVMKDEANMEVSKSSEKADKPEMGLGAEKGDVEMADFKEFKYEEPEMKSSESKASKSDAPKVEEPKEEKKEKVNEEFAGERKIGISFEFLKDPEWVKQLMGRGEVKEWSPNSFEYMSPLLKGSPKAIQFIMDKLNQLASKNIADYKCSMELVIDGKRNRIRSWPENLGQIKSLLMRKEVTKNEINGSINFDSEIGECLKNAGVQLDEFFKFDAPENGDYKFYNPAIAFSDRKYIRSNDRKFQEMCEKMGFDRFMKNCRRFFHQFGGSNTKEKLLDIVGDNKNISEIIKIVKDNSDKNGYKYFVDFMRKQNGLPPLDNHYKDDSKVEESFKDYLPRAGFIRDDDEDKSSQKMGIWGGQGTDDQLAKAKIIAKVKFANGDRMGRVTKDDLAHFDEYKEQYDEIYGSDYE